MNLKTINFDNSEISSVKFDLTKVDAINPVLVASVVNWQLAKKRSGSAKVKSMAEISGTTAKPHRQKGTGHARQGSKRSVQMRGGRSCFGPIPRSFDYNLSRKLVKKVVADLLKLKIKEDKFILFESKENKEIKTKQINKILKDNKVNSAVFLYDSDNEDNKSLLRSIRNIKNIKALDYKALNAYDILKFNFMVLDSKLLENIKKVVL